MNKLVYIFVSLAMSIFSCFSNAESLDCEKVAPNALLDKEIKVKANAAAKTLFRVGSIDGNSDITIRNLYEATKDKDKSHVNSSLLYFYCGLLNKHLAKSPEKAEKLLEQLVQKIWVVPVKQTASKPVYKISRSKGCGVELYHLSSGPQCGVIYNSSRGKVCGIEKRIAIKNLGYKSGNKTRYCQRKGYSESDGGKPNGHCLLYFQCSHSSFGTSGKYESCRHPDFGVKKYKSCRHPDHGVDYYE